MKAEKRENICQKCRYYSVGKCLKDGELMESQRWHIEADIPCKCKDFDKVGRR